MIMRIKYIASLYPYHMRNAYVATNAQHRNGYRDVYYISTCSDMMETKLYV